MPTHRILSSIFTRPVWTQRAGHVLRGAGSLLAGVSVYAFLIEHVGHLQRVTGPSMAPSLSPDYHASRLEDRVWANTWKPRDGLQRGMIVSYWSPPHPEKMCIKRIVALEGDWVYTRKAYPFPKTQVPPGHVWTEGDDWHKSLDSNNYGPVSKSLIIAKITHIVWPYSRAGRIEWEKWNSKTKVEHGEMPATVMEGP